MPAYFIVNESSGKILKTVNATTMNDIVLNTQPGEVVTPAIDGVDDSNATWTIGGGFVLFQQNLAA
jgi:hypothetical protein